MPEAAAAPSNGATNGAISEADGSSPYLANDAPERTLRPQIRHHDHHGQPKMPQAGMHGAGMAMAAGRARGIQYMLTISVVVALQVSASVFLLCVLILNPRGFKTVLEACCDMSSRI